MIKITTFGEGVNPQRLQPLRHPKSAIVANSQSTPSSRVPPFSIHLTRLDNSESRDP